MIINIIINSDDDFRPDHVDQTIELNNAKAFSYTFWQKKDRYPEWYDTKAIDLLYIALAVFAADRSLLRIDAKDGWCREIELHIPVLNYDIFSDNGELIDSILNYLTGDKWHIVFRPRDYNDLEIKHRDRKARKDKPEKQYDKICMFSGGMDSFIGAVDLLETCTDKNTLFVSHYGGGKGVKEYQDALINAFRNEYSLEQRDFCQFYAKAVDGKEDTTRSRSFMFFAHAIAIASAMAKQIELIIPENGLISLNIPMTYSRIGSSSTRTTHPYYMNKLQILLDNLGLNIKLKNPYQFMTKGEMLLECKNQGFMIKNIGNTMSCSHPDVGRNRGERETMHCGYCLPCVIRQSALKHANVKDNCFYYDREFMKVKEAKTIYNSYKLGVSAFDPQYAFMTIQQNGALDYNIDEYASLYVRGMKELKDYLDEIE